VKRGNPQTLEGSAEEILCAIPHLGWYVFNVCNDYSTAYHPMK